MKRIIFTILLVTLVNIIGYSQVVIPPGFINWLGNKTVQKSAIFTNGITIPHGAIPSLNGHPTKDGSLYWESLHDKLYAYDSTKGQFVLIGGDSTSTGGNGQFTLYKTVFATGQTNRIPVYTYGYKMIAAATQTENGSSLLFVTTIGDTTYVKYSAPQKDSIYYAFLVDGGSPTSTLLGITQNSSEYVNYITTNYTVLEANGASQNLIFDITGAVNLTLPTPITTALRVGISNISGFNVITSQVIYTTDANPANTIVNKKCELIWSLTKHKWYIIQD